MALIPPSLLLFRKQKTNKYKKKIILIIHGNEFAHWREPSHISHSQQNTFPSWFDACFCTWFHWTNKRLCVLPMVYNVLYFALRFYNRFLLVFTRHQRKRKDCIWVSTFNSSMEPAFTWGTGSITPRPPFVLAGLEIAQPGRPRTCELGFSFINYIHCHNA